MDPCGVSPPVVERALPDAVIVMDHFRLVRLSSEPVTNCCSGSPASSQAQPRGTLP
jgi:hypothetical protein